MRLCFCVCVCACVEERERARDSNVNPQPSSCLLFNSAVVARSRLASRKGPKREAMAGLRFCSTCNNLLEPSEDTMRKRLIFKCGTCQATEVSDSTLVYKRALKKKAETRLKLDKAVVLDPALPRTFDANCTRCKGKEAVFFKAESTSRDSDMALVFMCVRCKVSGCPPLTEN